MTTTDQLIRIHAVEHRMEAELDELEARLAALDEDIESAEAAIEAQWRREHWGHDPERPFRWRSAPRQPPPRSKARRAAFAPRPAFAA